MPPHRRPAAPAAWPQSEEARPRLKKRLGQHFLTNRGVLRRIVQTAELAPGDVVIEVGPGAGVLTAELGQRAGTVIAVELDASLLPGLTARFGAAPGFHLVQGDILEWPPERLLQEAGLPPGTPYKLVANLPYYITAPVLRHFLASAHPPQRLVVLVQYEVAKTLVAGPGDASLLAIATQYYGHPTLVAKVAPGSFSPPPKVSSAVVRIDTYPARPVDAPSDEAFFAAVRAGFRARRKQLRNSLAQGLGVPAADAATLAETAGIDPQRRPETLTLAEWAALAWAWERRH